MQYGESNNGFDCFSRGPVNEDVFAAPATAEGKAMDSDIQDITEQIHRLLLQVSQDKQRKREARFWVWVVNIFFEYFLLLEVMVFQTSKYIPAITCWSKK